MLIDIKPWQERNSTGFYTGWSSKETSPQENKARNPEFIYNHQLLLQIAIINSFLPCILSKLTTFNNNPWSCAPCKPLSRISQNRLSSSAAETHSHTSTLTLLLKTMHTTPFLISTLLLLVTPFTSALPTPADDSLDGVASSTSSTINGYGSCTCPEVWCPLVLPDSCLCFTGARAECAAKCGAWYDLAAERRKCFTRGW